jgi:hypothetical protein
MLKGMLEKEYPKLNRKVVAKGYKDLTDFFQHNFLQPFYGMADEIGSSYSTIKSAYQLYVKVNEEILKGHKEKEKLKSGGETNNRVLHTKLIKQIKGEKNG